MYDVLIVGCGVVGAATAYQLSRYDLKVCVCERYNDVANGCTKANTAILHFCGKRKPWNKAYVGRFGVLYKHYMQLAARCMT